MSIHFIISWIQSFLLDNSFIINVLGLQLKVTEIKLNRLLSPQLLQAWAANTPLKNGLPVNHCVVYCGEFVND
jgi:hypothetical protein